MAFMLWFLFLTGVHTGSGDHRRFSGIKRLQSTMAKVTAGDVERAAPKVRF